MAINMDAVLELSAKVDGMSQLLQLERSLSDVKGELGKYDQANKAAGLSTKEMGLMMTAASFAGNLLADAAQNLLANLTNMVTTTIQSGLAFEQTETRLRMLSEGYGEFDAVQNLITQNAAMLGQSQVQAANGFADIYARLRPLGIGLEDVNNVYLGFNSLAMQSGTTAEAASGAFMQLSQALGSGTLRGDEFNSVAEQVPGILIEVANVMGQPVGALRGLAAEGKITSTVVIEAMRNAADSSSAAMEQLSGSAGMSVARMQNAFQDLQAKIGRELVPIIAEAAKVITQIAANAQDLLIPAMQKASEEVKMLGFYLENIWQYNGLLAELGLNISAAFTAMERSALGLKSAGDDTKAWWENLINVEGVLNTIALALPPMVGQTLQLFNNQLIKEWTLGLDAITGREQARLDLMNKQVGAWNDQITKTNEAKAAATRLNEEADQQRKALEAQAGAKERLKQQTEELNADYDLLLQSLKTQSAEYDAQLQAMDDARSSEEGWLDLVESRLKRRLETVKTYKEEEQILGDLFNIAMRRIELEYQATLNSINEQIYKVQLQRDELELKYEQAQATLQVAKAEGLVTTAMELAVRTTLNSLQLAERQVGWAVKHGEVLAINAALQKQQAIETERAKFEQALLDAQIKYTKSSTTELVEETQVYTAEIERATTKVIELHGELREVDLAVVRISRGWMSVQQETLIAAEAAYNYEQYIKDTADRVSDLRKEGTQAAKAYADAIMSTLSLEQGLGVIKELSKRDTSLRRMAVGGYVTSPTAALIGEGGEPEYVIPASKMGAAAGAFLSGARGPAVLQPAAAGAGPVTVSIQTGPVVNMGGEQYVRKTDMSQAVNQAVAQVVQLLSGNTGIRQMVGI